MLPWERRRSGFSREHALLAEAGPAVFCFESIPTHPIHHADRFGLALAGYFHRNGIGLE
jgi:hypothetical protein